MTTPRQYLNRVRWAWALVFGGYRQAQSQLCTSDGAMCCLGVGSHLFAPKMLALVTSRNAMDIRTAANADWRPTTPPREFMQDTFGINSRNGSFRQAGSGLPGNLGCMNDSGASFRRIAWAIITRRFV